MSYILISEILFTFLFTQYFLNNYVNFKKTNFVTLICVFICFFFSFLTIIILPSDIASTFYRQCIADHTNKTDNQTLTTLMPNSTISEHKFINTENNQTECIKPVDFVEPKVLQILWNIIYWTNFFLTCFLLRVLSSFSVSGQFYFKKKLKEFFNYFYYELIIYSTLGVILLIYLIYTLSISVTSYFSIRALISSLNNIYSLINLTILLGIGLVKIPSIFFNKSEYRKKLDYHLFKIAKQRERLVLADCEFEDCLDEIKQVNDVFKTNHLNNKLRYCFNEIMIQTPEDFQKNIDQRVIYTENTSIPTINEDNLVKLNRKFKEVNNNKIRLESQIRELVDKAIELEEIIKNENESTRKFISYNNHYKSEKYINTLFKKYIFLPKIEWYFKCLIIKNFYYYLSFFLIALSCFLFLSELFHSLNLKFLVPVHLVFQLIDYLNLNLLLKIYIISLLLYISITAYHTLFTLNLFGYFKLTSNQQTDEFSLIFCTRYICSLSPAIALNMFNLIGLDYQTESKIRPSYTKIMGQLSFLNRLNDILWYIFPAILCLLSFFTFFNLTDKILHALGYERFTVQDDITTSLIEDGRNYIEKEKKLRLRKVTPKATTNLVNRTELKREDSQNVLLSRTLPDSRNINIPEESIRPNNSSVNRNLFDDV